jgi:hypothetical protein
LFAERTTTEENIMHTFTDTQGRIWRITLGLATCRHLAEQTDGRVDFVQGARTGQGKEVFEALSEDLALLGQVAWLLCESQAAEIGVSELDFADAFDMDVLEQFQTALIRAAIDFFPSRSRQFLLRALVVGERVAAEHNAKTQQQATQLMEDPQFEAMIRKAVTRGGKSGSGPDTSDSDLVISSTLNQN